MSGGLEAVPGIRRAKEMGLHVVVSDGKPDAPGLQLADDRIIASTYNVEETVRAAADYHRSIHPLDGVICMAADVPVTVASVAENLGLPGISLETARLAADKLLMKQRFRSLGIPTPWFASVSSANEFREIARERRGPLVVKPVDSRGARGVVLVTETVDLDWAYEQAREQSGTSRVMVEDYLPGPQVSTESVLCDDFSATPGFIDRNYEFLDRFAPYMIENGGQQPSVLSDQSRQAVEDMAVEAGRALGITRGIVKGDMVLTADGPKVIEVAARLSGGWMSSDQVPMATGVDLVAAAISLAVGDPVAQSDLFPTRSCGVAIRYFFPEKGRVTAIGNMKRLEEMEWVRQLTLSVGPGDIIEPVTNHTKRAGSVITIGSTCDEAVMRARQVVDEIKIETVAL